VRISVRFKNNVAVLALSGRFLAGSDGPFLRQKVKDLLDAGARKLVFDFSEVPYIDSTGLGFLAGSRSIAEEAGAVVALAGVNQHVQRLLDGVQLTQFFLIVKDEAQALAKLQDESLNSTATKPSRTRKRAQEPS